MIDGRTEGQFLFQFSIVVNIFFCVNNNLGNQRIKPQNQLSIIKYLQFNPIRVLT